MSRGERPPSIAKVPLPIDSVIDPLLAALKQHRSAILVAAPGAGKTTRLPPALLQSPLLDTQSQIIMLQPRRIAARATAARIAAENGWTLGSEVGYHVRFDKVYGPRTRLRVVTEGILTRQLIAYPFLEHVGAVILDEFHERSLHADLALALLKEIRQTVRPDLMLLVMSATLDAAPVAAYLGDCPIIDAPGRVFPVAASHLPASRQDWLEAAAEEIQNAIAMPPADTGDILVFLPGVGEINFLANRIPSGDYEIVPLHGSLPFEQQMRAIQPSDRRRVVLSTNVAETSLTLPNVRTVIDCGWARVNRFNAQRGLDRLGLERISRASAQQRSGRAGRIAPGRCVRLWNSREDAELEAYTTPELHRVDLASAVLSLHAWGKSDARGFDWFDPPRDGAIVAAERLLFMLGALEKPANGTLTEIGRQLHALPVHPRLARLMLEAKHMGATWHGASLAAILSEKEIALFDPRRPLVPSTRADSDMSAKLDQFARAERANFSQSLRADGIDPVAARQVARVRDDLHRLMRDASHVETVDEPATRRLLLWAFPDRVCRRRQAGEKAAAMVGGVGVRLADESVVCDAEFFVAFDLFASDRQANREAVVRGASAIDPAWLGDIAPGAVVTESRLSFDSTRKKVVARVQVRYHDLILSDELTGAIDNAKAGEVLHAALAERAEEIFVADEASAALLYRVALLRRVLPEHPWPVFDADMLSQLLAIACECKRGVDQLTSEVLSEALATKLPYPLDRMLEEQAPRTLTVPTGNRIALAYAANRPPVLAVRLQEMFGMTTTPTIARGRVPVVLHLLGPNYRPVQVTDDLASFWATTYFQVRKDLRVRYPKHSWPDDPLTAPPQAKGRSHR